MPVENPIPISEHTQSEDSPRKEIDLVSEYKWLAGALEAGGSISFINGKRQNQSVSPSIAISLQDTNPKIIDALCSVHSGSSKYRVRGSWKWFLGGTKAAELLSGIKPYAVLRSEAVIAAERWLNSDVNEKRAIVEEMQNYDIYEQPVSQDTYHELVADSAFLAGVLDNRGEMKFVQVEKEKKSYLQVAVRSHNKALLNAIQNKFGGDIKTYSYSGTPININGQSSQTKKDSYELLISGHKAINIVTASLVNLKNQPKENWNYRVSESQSKARSEQSEQIAQFVRQQLTNYENRKIDRILGIEEIAAKFGIKQGTVRNRLKDLDKESRQQYEKILRTENRESITRQQKGRILGTIKKELRLYAQDPTARCTPNQVFADALHISVNTLMSTVIAKLSDEERQHRQKALHSQSARDSNKKRANKK